MDTETIKDWVTVKRSITLSSMGRKDVVFPYPLENVRSIKIVNFSVEKPCIVDDHNKQITTKKNGEIVVDSEVETGDLDPDEIILACNTAVNSSDIVFSLSTSGDRVVATNTTSDTYSVYAPFAGTGNAYVDILPSQAKTFKKMVDISREIIVYLRSNFIETNSYKILKSPLTHTISGRSSSSEVLYKMLTTCPKTQKLDFYIETMDNISLETVRWGADIEIEILIPPTDSQIVYRKNYIEGTGFYERTRKELFS